MAWLAAVGLNTGISATSVLLGAAFKLPWGKWGEGIASHFPAE